jgi:ATP-dependent Clp protease ATP-binding subunit ClpA/ActR/RegA family two-component response regulator
MPKKPVEEIESCLNEPKAKQQSHEQEEVKSMSEENNTQASETAPQTAPRSARDYIALISEKVVGQDAAMKSIVPFVYMWQAGLAPEGRPAGIFLLLGPTGTGKTKTVEAIAEVLHGSAKNILKIDCGEFQMEHEIAKLLGSPPGYLGHRETVPMLNQQQLSDVTSEHCDLSLVLFDEIEKAAPSMSRLLLGILDKAVLRLGDNTTVNFEKSLIFFTSNLGAREMMKEMRPDLGFHTAIRRERSELIGKLENVALAAVRKRFSPEFVNRIDAVVTYQPLDTEALANILDQHIVELQSHVNTRLGERCFQLDVSPESREFLLLKGTSEEYGARELKRTLHRHLTQPLATMVASGQLERGARVRFDLSDDAESLSLSSEKAETIVAPRYLNPTVLIVDDNHQLLQFLKTEFEEAGWELMTAETAREAHEVFGERRPNTVLLDYMLGADDGLQLGLQIHAKAPETQIIIMTGGGLSPDEEAVCKEHDFPILHKPFLVNNILHLIGYRFQRATTAAG